MHFGSSNRYRALRQSSISMVLFSSSFLLIQKTPYSKANVNITANNGYTALIWAAAYDRQTMVQRVDFMINAGLLDEVRKLLRMKLSKTAYYCIGIREIQGCFKGQYELSEAIYLIKRNSRHFAKKQMTWFNKNKDITWIDLKKGEDLFEVSRIIFNKIR